MRSLNNYRFGVGVISKNVVDSCISYANKHDVGLALICSRRQVEHNGGYANNWTTQSFSRYVKSRTGNILLFRDHGGLWQGQFLDDGFSSLEQDCAYLDFIHIDPWRAAKDLSMGFELTYRMIKHCYDKNPDIQYEIGTEQSIYKYSADQLRDLIVFLNKRLSSIQFSRIRFAVIQSGTALKGNTNTGKFDNQQLVDMLSVCDRYGFLSKEHNGDYLPITLIHEKFAMGLNAINIAPEFGQIETLTYLREIKESDMFVDFYNICLNSEKWLKWLSPEQANDKLAVINVSGHYVLSEPEFLTKIKGKLGKDIDIEIQNNIIKKLDQLYGK